jgi:guanine deaminase
VKRDEAEAYLRRAVELGAEAMRAGRGGPFGAVIVLGSKVIGEGANAVIATSDPTAHAEITAIRAACTEARAFSLVGATIFASSEPCPMCLAAIYWARIDRIVFAAGRAIAAAAGFDDAFFYDELSREPGARRVPMRQIDFPDAAVLFDEWRNKPDKIAY